MIILLIFLLAITTKCFDFPHFIWVYNDKPIAKSSLLVQLQYQRIQYLRNDWNLKLITPGDAKTYVRQFNYQNTILKNILKFDVLNKFGGVWIQLSGILIEDMKWLSQLDNNKDVTKHSGKTPRIFTFSQSLTSKQQIFQGQLTLQTSFVASFSNNMLLQQTLTVYMDMIKKGQKVTGYKTTTDQTVAKLYDDDNQLILVQAFRRILNPKDKNISRFELWTINADQGPTQYLSRVNWTQSRIVSFLSTVRGTKVNRQKKSRYYARMRQHETEIINLFLDNNLGLSQRAETFMKGYREGEVMKILCDQQNPFLLTNSSVIDTYLLTYESSIAEKYKSKLKIRRADYNSPCPIHNTLQHLVPKLVGFGISFLVFLLHPLISKYLIKFLQFCIRVKKGRKDDQRQNNQLKKKNKRNKPQPSVQTLQVSRLAQVKPQ